MCWKGAVPHAPTLSGQLTSAPLGAGGNWLVQLANRVLSGQRAQLTVTDLDLNLKSMEIAATKIRFGAFGLRCISLKQVDQKFGAEANNKLQQVMKQIGAPQITVVPDPLTGGSFL
jgi:hypothetical protein